MLHFHLSLEVVKGQLHALEVSSFCPVGAFSLPCFTQLFHPSMIYHWIYALFSCDWLPRLPWTIIICSIQVWFAHCHSCRNAVSDWNFLLGESSDYSWNACRTRAFSGHLMSHLLQKYTLELFLAFEGKWLTILELVGTQNVLCDKQNCLVITILDELFIDAWMSVYWSCK